MQISLDPANKASLVEKESGRLWPSFQHHVRILLVLIPAWLIIISVSGRVVLGVIAFFAAISTLFYSMRLYNFSLLTLVVGITICNILQLLIGTTLLANHFFFIFLLINNIVIMGLTAAYLSLLFPYIHHDPSLKHVPRLTEKLLFSLLPISTTSLITWNLASQFGLSTAAYWMLLIQVFMYFIFAVPLKSSYVKSKIQRENLSVQESWISSQQEDDEDLIVQENSNIDNTITESIGGVKYDELICDETQSYFQTIQLWFPLGMYIFTYWRSIFMIFPSSAAEWNHFVDISILAIFPFLLLGLLGTVGKMNPLWWSKVGREDSNMRRNNQNRGKQSNFSTYKTFLTISICLLVICIEYRVIFFSFSHLLNGLNSPWNYIALTLGIYSVIASIAIHFNEPIPSSTSSQDKINLVSIKNAITQEGRRLSYTLAIIAAVCFSMVFGLPIMLYPAPILAAMAFISFYFERKWWMYMLFVIGVMLGISWFLYKSLWSLQYTFFTLAGVLNLKFVVVLLIVMIGLSSLLAGLLALDIHRKWANILIIINSILLALMEEVCHMEELSNHDVEVYPSYLVIMTTVFGILMARKLYQTAKINSNVLFIVTMIFSSKMFVLLKPVSWPTLSGVLILSPPLYLVYRIWSSENISYDIISSKRVVSIYCAWMAIACILTRYTLIQRVLEIIAGEIHDHASPALIHGFALILFGMSLIPLSWAHPLKAQTNEEDENSFHQQTTKSLQTQFDMRRRKKRFISFLGFAFIGIGFAALSSQILFGSATQSSFIGTGAMSSILGTRTGLPLLSTISLLSLVVIGFLVATGTVDVENSPRQRIFTSMCAGLSFGTFVSPFVMSTSIYGIHANPEDSSPLFVTFGIAMQFQLVALFITYSNWGKLSKRSSKNESDRSDSLYSRKQDNLNPYYRYDSKMIQKLAPACYVGGWLLWPLLFLGVVVLSSLGHNARRDELEAYNLALIALQAFIQALIALYLKSIEPQPEDTMALKERPQWIPDIANLAAISAYGLSVVVNWRLGGSDWAILVLSPLLLLLQPYGTFSPVIQRKVSPYFYLYVVVCAGLVLSINAKTWLHGPLSFIWEMLGIASYETDWDWDFDTLMNVFVEGLAHTLLTPSMLLIGVWLWTNKAPMMILTIACTALSLSAMFITELTASNIITMMNVVGGIVLMIAKWASTEDRI